LVYFIVIYNDFLFLKLYKAIYLSFELILHNLMILFINVITFEKKNQTI